MYQLRQNRTGPLKPFYELFGDRLNTDDFHQFFSNRVNKGRITYLLSELYTADRLADVILEEYGIRNKLKGNVILVLPEPEYDIPVFMFQLGGNDKQTIALLDISPTQPDVDYTPLLPVFEKYRDLLKMEPSKLDWVNSICSPYLLHCQYDEVDVGLFTEALEAYLKVWIEHYYIPAKKLPSETAVEHATAAVFKFKRVLHDNDPAYGIFKKEWGQPVADAFFYLETRHHPALPPPEH
ncbi:MAG: hypothetical protein V2J12_12565 [Gammaproteobacteria bacterium]|nr:hypothetical protein [Gammaproteobacteria bacterium]